MSRTQPVLVALAGLPATGKTTLAKGIAPRVKATILNKDNIRNALFPAQAIEYSGVQDDFCMDVIYRLASFMFRRAHAQTIIIDGRTFSRQAQVAELMQQSKHMNATPVILECVCSTETAKARLARATAERKHSAANRSPELYDALRRRAQPIVQPKLVLRTDEDDIETCVAQAVEYIRETTLPYPAESC